MASIMGIAARSSLESRWCFPYSSRTRAPTSGRIWNDPRVSLPKNTQHSRHPRQAAPGSHHQSQIRHAAHRLQRPRYGHGSRHESIQRASYRTGLRAILIISTNPYLAKQPVPRQLRYRRIALEAPTDSPGSESTGHGAGGNNQQRIPYRETIQPSSGIGLDVAQPLRPGLFAEIHMALPRLRLRATTAFHRHSQTGADRSVSR